MLLLRLFVLFFFFNDTATTEIYTLSLHDALPISRVGPACGVDIVNHSARTYRRLAPAHVPPNGSDGRDRKSTRLNSSHQIISYAVFCLKKKKTNTTHVHISIRTLSVYLNTLSTRA